MTTEDYWPFRINWGSGFEETFSFRTDILTSRDGTEQRIAERTAPRIGYRFTSLLSGTRFQRAGFLLSDKQARKLWVPHPRDYVRSTAVLSAGFTLVQVDATPAWLAAGERVFIEPPGSDMFGASIDQITTGVDLSEALTEDLPAGSKLFRAVPGYFAGSSPVPLATSRVGGFSTEFQADPKDAFHHTYSDADETLNGLEFFKLKPNWAGPPGLNFDQNFEVLDLGYGVYNRITPISFTARETSLSFTLRNAAQVDDMLGLFHRCRGRQKAFYYAYPGDELRPVSGIAGGAGAITVAGREAYDNLQDATRYKRISVQTAGAELVREVTGISLDINGDTVLTLNSTISTPIALESLSRIAWVGRVRFASDSISVLWRTDGVAEVDTRFTALEDS